MLATSRSPLLPDRENIFIPERIVSEINDYQNYCDMQNRMVHFMEESSS
jgi:hypothetical protein